MKNKKVLCLAVDVVGAERLPATLAFMVGACQAAQVDYTALSINSLILQKLTQREFDQIWHAVKLDTLSSDEIDCTLAPVVNEVLTRITAYKPDIVAVSVFSYLQLPLTKLLLTKVRQHCDATIVIGGAGITPSFKENTSAGQHLLKSNLVDAYVLGDGDVTFPKYLCGEEVIGVTSANNPVESWALPLKSLDTESIFLSYQGIDLSPYSQNLKISIITSRGCVRNCTFCDVSKLWPKFSFKSGARTVEEIKQIVTETNCPHFMLVDSLMNGSLSAFREFNELMATEKASTPLLKDFTYCGLFIIRGPKAHPESMYAAMAAAGCETLSIGVETGSDRLRSDMAKKFTNDELQYHFNMCRKYGIQNSLFLFVGYPTETDEDFEETIKFLHNNQHYLIDHTIIGISATSVFSLLPNTPVFAQNDHMVIEQLAPSDYDSLLRFKWKSLRNPALTPKIVIERDLQFRKVATQLRYPIHDMDRYLDYLNLAEITDDFVMIAD